MKTRDLTLIAVMAALICIAGPLTVSIGPIPLSLATFAIYLAGTVSGPRKGTAAVAVYLALGLIGIPVFSGFSGGFQKLAGVTGGYLIGYLPCAFLSGLGAELAQGSPKKKGLLPAFLALGTAVLYLIGTVWFMIQTGNTLSGALSLCVLPFLPGDAAKIIAACLLTAPLRRAIRRVPA